MDGAAIRHNRAASTNNAMTIHPPLQQSFREIHQRPGKPTSDMRTQPLPLAHPAASRRRERSRMKRFAIPFLTVIGYYAIGIFTFSVMAAANVPGGGSVLQFAWQAVESTSLIALVVALAAGRWWV